MVDNTLFIIPARGGSKGIPGKNIKPLGGKPLIYYSIDFARQFTSDENICVSSDSNEIIEVVEKYGLKTPFKRPEKLATDHANSNEVIIHAVEYYQSLGVDYNKIVLLQPTSPFREKQTLGNAFDIYSESCDMVVSVKETTSNPYYVLFEEDADGFLKKSKESNATRRQDAPVVYELNGSIYLINVKSLLKKHEMSNFTKVKKVLMDDLHSLDIDTHLDWAFAEFLIEKNN